MVVGQNCKPCGQKGFVSLIITLLLYNLFQSVLLPLVSEGGTEDVSQIVHRTETSTSPPMTYTHSEDAIGSQLKWTLCCHRYRVSRCLLAQTKAKTSPVFISVLGECKLGDLPKKTTSKLSKQEMVGKGLFPSGGRDATDSLASAGKPLSVCVTRWLVGCLQ